LLSQLDEVQSRTWLGGDGLLAFSFLLLGAYAHWCYLATFGQESSATGVGITTYHLSRTERCAGSSSHGASLLIKELLVDFWGFMKVRKKFWLAPIILVLILLGLLLIFAQTSPLAPFIYPLF
jgi:hypothetical protein